MLDHLQGYLETCSVSERMTAHDRTISLLKKMLVQYMEYYALLYASVI